MELQKKAKFVGNVNVQDNGITFSPAVSKTTAMNNSSMRSIRINAAVPQQMKDGEHIVLAANNSTVLLCNRLSSELFLRALREDNTKLDDFDVVLPDLPSAVVHAALTATEVFCVTSESGLYSMRLQLQDAQNMASGTWSQLILPKGYDVVALEAGNAHVLMLAEVNPAKNREISLADSGSGSVNLSSAFSTPVPVEDINCDDDELAIGSLTLSSDAAACCLSLNKGHASGLPQSRGPSASFHKFAFVTEMTPLTDPDASSSLDSDGFVLVDGEEPALGAKPAVKRVVLSWGANDFGQLGRKGEAW